MSDLSQSVRRAFLRDLLAHRVNVTPEEAWQACRDAGLCTGGEAPELRTDLNVIGRRHDGWCRLDKEPRHVRRAAVRYADYWTTR